jgi:hypothetical protein
MEMLQEHFARVTDLIRRCKLERLAGYPVVLDFLKRHSEISQLGLVDVWRGILRELLQEPNKLRRRSLKTEPEDRFVSAARIAAVLTLTNREVIHGYSPLPGVPTIRNIFATAIDANRKHLAALEACESSAFRSLPQESAYRFAHRNIQDWLCAFGMATMGGAQLRSALADIRGKLFPRHREMAALLSEVCTEPSVRALIDEIGGGVTLPSDALEPSLQQSLTCIDRLEQIAQTSPGALRLLWNADQDLRRLSAPGLGSELARRLSNRACTPHVRLLLLDIALATEAIETADVALALVADAGQESQVRERAMMLLIELGGEGHLRQLEAPIAMSTATEDIQHRLRAMVIYEFLKRRIWGVPRAAQHAPPRDPNVIDTRGALLQQIEKEINLGDARELLKHSRHIMAVHGNVERLPGMLEKAATMIRDQPHLTENDQWLLAETVLEIGEYDHAWPYASGLFNRLRPNPLMRRRFYAHDVRAVETKQREDRHWRHALGPEDVDWLLEKAQTEWKAHRSVWEDVYRLASVAEVGPKDQERWQHIKTVVDQHAPGLADQLERDWQAAKEACLRIEKDQQRREAASPPSYALGDLVERILSCKDLSYAARMRELAYHCFVSNFRPHNVTGSWDDLSREQQSRVRETCRRGLEETSPTPLPDSQTFPGTILAEGYAFLDTIASSEGTGWLNTERIITWLPTTLFAVHENAPQIIRDCWEVDTGATEQVLQQSVERELRSGRRYAAIASEIPAECWTRSLAAHVAARIYDDSASPEARRRLLEILSARAPEAALPIATDLARREITAGVDDQLRQGGLNCLLVLRPEEAVPLVEASFRKHGSQSLECLSALYGERDELRFAWSECPDVLLERLGAIILESHPVAADPDPQGPHRVTSAEELRWVRDRIVSILLERDTPEARAALDRLAKRDEHLRLWLETLRSEAQARDLLGDTGQSSIRDPSAIALPDAVALLDQDNFRLVRSDDDLLKAVLEVLQLVQQDVAADLPMLYEAPKRRARGKGRGKSAARKHLAEDALQAYIQRRLHDLLPSRIVPTGQALREDRIRYRRRLDLRVQAPCFDGKTLATVVIEVKWSDNPETESSLTDQLGRKYLQGEGLAHGIFLVGWCGEWRHKRRKQVDCREMEAYLATQRDEYCRPGANGHGLTIELALLNLEWHDPMDKHMGSGRTTAPRRAGNNGLTDSRRTP